MTAPGVTVSDTFDLGGLRYLVVGAGFFGSVAAERIASVLGQRVVVIDRRDHPGGISHSAVDPATGIECHTYGSHIFHTGDREVWDYLTRFCSFNHYRHRVMARHRGRTYPIPVNLDTINPFYGVDLTPEEARAFITAEAAREGIGQPANFQEAALAAMGRPLYEAFIGNYTLKQWGTDPRALPADLLRRIPLRFDHLTDYFQDPWQGIPVEGYHALFRKILSHPLIELRLGLDYARIRHLVPADCTVVYTGPVDAFFDFRFGRLGWRGAVFRKDVLPVEDFQGTSVVNHPEPDVPFIRTHEFRHFHPERDYTRRATVVFTEYSRCGRDTGDPMYPRNTREDGALLALYRTEAGKLPRVVFGGRLGLYRYLNMDQAVAAALAVFRERLA
jgi:UDP-galactopyranose mutase